MDDRLPPEVAMFFVLCGLLALGIFAAQFYEISERILFLVVGSAGGLWALHTGAYWYIFPRGHGFFTANRTSALLIFAGALFGPVIWEELKDRRRRP